MKDLATDVWIHMKSMLHNMAGFNSVQVVRTATDLTFHMCNG